MKVRSILTNEAARLRVGTGAVHDTIWQNPTGSPFYAVDTIDDVVTAPPSAVASE